MACFIHFIGLWKHIIRHTTFVGTYVVCTTQCTLDGLIVLSDVYDKFFPKELTVTQKHKVCTVHEKKKGSWSHSTITVDVFYL